jgi:isovaleryl-CoA dehydrogenase
MELPFLRFEHGETIAMLRATVQNFARAEVAPRAAEIDAANQFPPEMWKKLGALGLLGITVEEEYGGTALGYLAHIVAMEELSRASAAIGLSYGAHSNLCVNQIHRNGDEAQKSAICPSSSRASTSARSRCRNPAPARMSSACACGRNCAATGTC